MLDRFIVRVGLIGLAFAAFFVLGYMIKEAGGLYFGLPFWIMLLGLVIVIGLYIWDKATEGSQAYVVLPVTGILAVFAYRFYIGLDAAGEQEFLASLRAVAIVLLGLGASIVFVLILDRHPNTASTTVTETSETVASAPESAPSTL